MSFSGSGGTTIASTISLETLTGTATPGATIGSEAGNLATPDLKVVEFLLGVVT